MDNSSNITKCNTNYQFGKELIESVSRLVDVVGKYQIEMCTSAISQMSETLSNYANKMTQLTIHNMDFSAINNAYRSF